MGIQGALVAAVRLPKGPAIKECGVTANRRTGLQVDSVVRWHVPSRMQLAHGLVTRCDETKVLAKAEVGSVSHGKPEDVVRLPIPLTNVHVPC